mgnify:CR=1 FL=1
MANNPAFNRLEKDAQSGYAGFRTDGSPTGGMAGATHAATDQLTAQQLQRSEEHTSELQSH